MSYVRALAASGEPGFGPGLTDPEAVARKPQIPADKALTKNDRNNLAEILAHYPNLARIVKAWPELSDETRTTIIKVVEEYEVLDVE